VSCAGLFLLGAGAALFVIYIITRLWLLDQLGRRLARKDHEEGQGRQGPRREALLMALVEACRCVASRFEYRRDKFGIWRVMRGRPMRGDCEDFSLTVMHCYYRGWLPMLKAIWRREAKVWTVTAANGRHAVGQIGNLFFDNWTKRPLHEGLFYDETGHKPDKAYHPLYVYWRLTGWVGRVIAALAPVGLLIAAM
jgi:hypothetical protein